MSDDDTDYLSNLCPSEPLWCDVNEKEAWQVVVGNASGVAFGMWMDGGTDIPRFELRALLKAGFKP